MSIAAAAFTSPEKTLLPSQVSREQHSYSPGAFASPAPNADGLDAQAPQVSPELQEAVLQLLECADRFSMAMSRLEGYSGGQTLSEPWSDWARDAIAFIRDLLPNV